MLKTCKWVCAAAALVWPGCSFDTTGVGSAGESLGEASTDSGGSEGSSASTSGASDSDPSGASDSNASGASDSDPSGASDGDPSGASDSDSSDSSTGMNGSGPSLTISDAPAFDYGPVNLDADAEHRFTVTNAGDETATAVVVQPPTGPFSIVSNSCPDTLEPAESCDLDVVAAPMVWGPVTEALRIEYGPQAGSLSVELTLTGTGSTGNLLNNGDAEAGGNPPVGWTELQGDTWIAEDFSENDGIPSHGGSNAIFGGANASGDGELVQDVDLAQWNTYVQAQELAVQFEGWARSYFPNDDPYRIIVEFLDDGGTPVGEEVLDTGFQVGTAWTQYTGSAKVPATADRVRVALYCQLLDNYCDTFFDDLVLRVGYAP